MIYEIADVIFAERDDGNICYGGVTCALVNLLNLVHCVAVPKYIATGSHLGDRDDEFVHLEMRMPFFAQQLSHTRIGAVEVSGVHVQVVIIVEEKSKEQICRGELDIWEKFQGTFEWPVV